jgi:hypothetical protein
MASHGVGGRSELAGRPLRPLGRDKSGPYGYRPISFIDMY